MKWIKVTVSALITLLLVILLNISFKPLPAIGPFFNPVTGFWQSAKSQTHARSEWHTHVALRDSVLVVYDDRLVPHIFAKNDHDLFFTQGFLTARDRLWQMDLTTRAAAGRLSEVLGDRALEMDKYQRRIGMVYGAQNKLNFHEQHPEVMAPIQHYTAGVNYFIDNLSPRNLPIEYKLIGFTPERWTPLKSMLVMMNMSATLNGRTDAQRFTNTLNLLGDDFVQALYNPYHELIDPIIPSNTPWPFEPIRLIPESDDVEYEIENVGDGDSDIQLEIPEADPSIGSNSWAVSGSKTVTGKPLLANDPHLNMSLPSIWYEIQLNSPNMNSYGVTIPGLPSIVIGFNENIAWGFTNSGANVMDIYEITFNDDFSEYYHDGTWKPTRYSIETFLVKGKKAVVDTVFYTHHGPIPNRTGAAGRSANYPVAHAVKWIAHQPSLELKTFLKLNRAKDYNDFYEALKHFDGPAQNFTYADRHGTIALWHNGKFPIRYEGMGDFILDGSIADNDWNAFIPHDHKPFSKNPERGFVSSANQHPTDPDYPYYLGRFFASFERGARINEVLDGSNQLSYINMMLLQLDNKNLRARLALPEMLKHGAISGIPMVQSELINKLGNWNFSMDATSIEATLFHYWWSNFYDAVWNDVFPNDGTEYLKPSNAETLRLLLNEPDSEFFRKSSGNTSISLPQLIANAWNKTIGQLKEGNENSEEWEWWKYNRVSVPHLAEIPAFSRSRIKTGGTNIAVNAMRGTHGPSWRMVVSLEDRVRGWGIYPGGQSGNPGNKNYDAFIDDWADGAFYPLHFYRNAQEALEHLSRGINTTEVRP